MTAMLEALTGSDRENLGTTDNTNFPGNGQQVF